MFTPWWSQCYFAAIQSYTLVCFFLLAVDNTSYICMKSQVESFMEMGPNDRVYYLICAVYNLITG